MKSIKYIRTNITRYGASTHQLNLASFQEKFEDVSDRCLRHLTTSGMDSSRAKDEAESWKQLQAEWRPNSRPKQFFSEKQREINSGMRANEDASIFFYTLHKCGSTLIERRVLGRSPLHRHVDYASELYSGRRTEPEAETITFEKHGCIYGPIRISAREGPVARLLVAPTTTKDFLSDRKAIFMVRDPRDIIVSSYYSFGYSHSISQQPEIAENQRRGRSRIQEVSIDEYARGARLIANHRDNFLKIEKLASACPNCTVIRYDDMIDDFDKFAAQLTELLPLSSSILDQLREESRPSTQESVGSHKRSGATGGFRTKLNEETISILNEELGDILDSFGYHP